MWVGAAKGVGGGGGVRGGGGGGYAGDGTVTRLLDIL